MTRLLSLALAMALTAGLTSAQAQDSPGDTSTDQPEETSQPSVSLTGNTGDTTATTQITTQTRSVTEVVTREGRVLRIGDRVEEDYAERYTPLEDPAEFDLPPLDPGHLYIRANRSVLVIDRESGEILELIRLAAALTD